MNHTLCVAWLPSVISKLTLIINFNSRPVNLTLIFCLPSPRAHSRTVSPRLTRCTQSDAVRDRTGSAILYIYYAPILPGPARRTRHVRRLVLPRLVQQRLEVHGVPDVPLAALATCATAAAARPVGALAGRGSCPVRAGPARLCPRAPALTPLLPGAAFGRPERHRQSDPVPHRATHPPQAPASQASYLYVVADTA